MKLLPFLFLLFISCHPPIDPGLRCLEGKYKTTSPSYNFEFIRTRTGYEVILNGKDIGPVMVQYGVLSMRYDYPDKVILLFIREHDGAMYFEYTESYMAGGANMTVSGLLIS